MASPLAQMLAQASASGASPPPFRATVAPTDVEKAYNDYNNTMMQAYAAKLNQQNSMWGGLAGLGSAGISTLPKLLSMGGTAAAGAGAADAGATAAAAELGATGIGDTLASLGPLAFLAI